LICLAVSLFQVVYPVYVIRPFRHQGATELRVALAMMGFRPILMAAAALAVIAAVHYRRTRQGRWGRPLTAVPAAATLAFAALSRTL
jgi:hypothetical protein